MLKISIKAARINANLTQRQAAERLGITRQSLMGLEKTPDEVSYSLAEKMSRVYKIPKDNLIFLPQDSTFSGSEDSA